MKEIMNKNPLVAPLDIPILIQGETGTDKEKLANGFINYQAILAK